MLKSLRMLIIDEADLLMSLNSLRSVQTMLPPSELQRILLSATLTEGVASMKGQLLRNPTNITLTEDEQEPSAGKQAMAKAVKSLGQLKREAEEDLDEENDRLANDSSSRCPTARHCSSTSATSQMPSLTSSQMLRLLWTTRVAV